MTSSLKRVWTIFKKDFKDAIRDARVLMAIVTPLLVGIVYSYIIDDDIETPSADIAVVSPGGAGFVNTLDQIVGDAVNLHIQSVDSAEEVQQRVAKDDSDVGLVMPAEFEEEVTNGNEPELLVVVPESISVGGEFVLSAIDPALRVFAGQPSPATITVDVAETVPGSLTPIEEVGSREYLVLFSYVLTVAMIALLAIPVVLAEETEKKTYDALAMIASDREIVAAKALLGGSWIALAVTILLAVTRIFPVDWPMFVISIILLAVAMLGIGLLIAGILKSPGQLNTWSGLVLMPAIAPAFLVGIGLSDRIEDVASLFPTGASMKMLVDSFSDRSIFENSALSVVVLVLWGIVAFGLLQWQLSRRRA